MIKNIKMKKAIFIGVLISLVLIIGIIAINIGKNGINKVTNVSKKDVETEIQAIIDSVKQEKENENINSIETEEPVSATLEDLKNKFSELGYNLDVSTGEVTYNNHKVTISNDLTILSIEEMSTRAYFNISKYDGENLEGLLILENANGIEKVTIGETQYDCKNKEKVAFDRKLIENQLFEIKIKAKNEAIERVYRLQPKTEIAVVNYKPTEEETERTIKIDYSQTENVTNMYSLDNKNTWNEYVGEFNIDIAQVSRICPKTVWNDGAGTIEIEELYYEYTSESLFDVIKYSIGETGNYEFTVNGQNYPIHAYVYDEDLTLSSNTTFGEANDVGTASAYAKNMVIVKVNGDLTINSGVTLTAYGTAYGGPKGMFVYATGTVTNNGTITMTARGARAPGENVYLYRNLNGSYEYIPGRGASGGGAKSVYTYGWNAGTNGGNGSNRATGGGGSGAAVTWRDKVTVSTAGSVGTSYSGGSGGGGAWAGYAGAASYNGGNATSGNISGYGGGAGGGAGNPAGSNAGGGTGAQNGTGGLLIVYGENVYNNSVISANGSYGGSAYRSGGGGSGGGSVNIFFKKALTKGSITVSGGAGGRGTRNGESANGGAGGSGSINCGTIISKSYSAR